MPSAVITTDRQNATYEYKRYMRDGSVQVIGAVVRTKKKKKEKTQTKYEHDHSV